MTEPIDVSLQADAGNSDKEIGKVTSAFKELARAIEAINKLDLSGIAQMANNARSPLDQMKRDMSALSSTAKQEGRKLGKSVAEGMAQGMAEAGETVRAAEKRKWQEWYDQQLAMNAKFKDRVGTLARLQAGGISLSPTDREYLKQQREMFAAQTALSREAEKTRKSLEDALTKSAGKLDPRTLLGLTPNIMQKSAAASADVFKQAFAAEALKGKAASNIDVHTLLGLTPNIMQKSAAASADVFKQAFAAEALKGKAASNIDVRTLLGLTPSVLQKSAAASAEVFKAEFAADTKGLRKGATVDVRDLLGLTPAAMKKSARESADVFAQAFAVETLRAKSASNIDPRTLLGLPNTSNSAKASASVFAEAFKKQDAADAAALKESARNEAAAVKAAAALRKKTEALTETTKAAKASGGPMKTLVNHLTDVHSAARGVASGFGLMWLTWGHLTPLLAGAALSNGLVQTAQKGKEFETVLAGIENLGGASAAEVDKLSKAALTLGSSTQYGPIEIAQGLKTLSLAGLDATQSLQALKPVLNFSVVSELPLDKAAESILAISKAFSYSASEISVAGDVVAKTAAVSMSSVSDMTEAFRQSSTVAQQFGVTLQDQSVMLALLSQVGVKGSAAGTAVRNMYVELMGSSKKARKVLEETLQINVFDNAAKAMKPLPVIMGDLAKALSGKTFEAQTKILNDLGNERGMKAISAGLSAMQQAAQAAGVSLEQYTTQFQKMQQELEDAPGFMAVAAAGMSATTENIMKSVGGALQSSLIKAFEEMSPYLINFSVALRETFKSEEFISAVKSTVYFVGEAARTIASATKFIWEHRDALLAVGGGLVALRAYATVAGVLGTAWAGAVAGLRTFTAMTLIAGPASASAAVGVTALSAAANALKVALGPIALALSAAAAAYMYLTSASGQAADAAKEAKRQDEEALRALEAKRSIMAESMNTEIAQLQLYIKHRGDEKKMAEEAKIAQGKAQEEALNSTIQKILMIGREKAAQLTVEAAVKRVHAAELERDASFGGSHASTIDRLKAEAAALDEQSRNVRAAAEFDANVERGRVALLKNLAKQKAGIANELATGRRRPTAGSEDYSGTDTAKDPRAKALSLRLDNELAQVSKRYNDELQMVTKLQTNEQNLLRASFDAKLVDAGSFYARELQLAEEAEAAKLRLTDKAEADYTAAMLKRIADAHDQYDKAISASKGKKGQAEADARSLEVLQQALQNLGNEAETVFQAFGNTRKEVTDGAKTRVEIQAIKARGELKALDEASKEFWLSEALRTQEAARSTAIEDALRYASPEQAAYIQASAAENERLREVMLNLQKQYDVARDALNGYTNEMLNAEIITEEMKQGERDRIEVLKRLKTQIDLVKGATNDMADEAGMRALTKFRKEEEAALKNGVSDAIVTGLMEGGEAGKGKLRSLIMAELRKPITMVVQAIVNPVMGALMGGLGLSSTAAAAGSAGGSLLGSAASSLGGSALSTSLFGPSGVSGFAQSVGAGVADAMGIGELTAASAPATSGAGYAIGQALPYVGVALLALNALGVFRSKKIVGGGLMGTLGEGDIQSYDLQRRGGTLFSGPKYSVVNQQRSQFSDMIQSDWKRATAAVVTMAESLGLATDAAKGFTAVLGTDVIHPDTGGMGINLDDLRDKNLTPEQYNAEVRSRINEAILSGSEELAQKLIGSWKTTTETIKKTVSTGFSTWDDGYTQSMVEVEEQVTRTEYVVSEYARSNETALETLTRLATSLTTVNNAFDVLGWNIQMTGLAGANASSDFVDLFGGIDAFSSVASQYYEDFYSDSERASTSLRMVSDELAKIGITEVPTTLAGYRALIEGQKDLLLDDDPTTGNISTVVGLMKQAAAFAAAKRLEEQAAEDAAQAAKKAADEAQRLAEKYQQITEKLTDEASQIAVDTLRALGKEEEAVALERQKAIEGMDAYQISLYDANQIKKLELKALKEKNDLEGQWAVLMGDTNFARDKELAALEPGNRALQQRIWALEDERAALDAFYSAADSAAESLLGYADQVSYKYARQALKLNQAGVGTGDVLADASFLASMSPQEIRQVAGAFFQTYGAANKATPVVLEVADALIQLANAANPIVEAFTGAADRLLQGSALSTFKVYSAVIDALSAANIPADNAAALTDMLAAMSSDELRQAAFAFLAVDENSTEAKAAVIKLADTLITMRDAAVEAKKAAEEQVRSTYKAITDALKAEEDKIISGFVGAQNAIIDGVVEAQINVNNLIKESAASLRSFADTIEDFIDSINNSDLSGADKITQYAQAQSQLAILKAQALAGDEKAQGKITDAAQRVLDLGRGNSATSVDYRRIVAQVKNSLQEVADAARDKAQELDPVVVALKPLEEAQKALVEWEALANKYDISDEEAQKALVEWEALANKYDISDEVIQKKLKESQDKLLTVSESMEQWTRLTKDAAISSERIAQAQLTAVQSARTDWLKAADLKAEADRIIGAAGLGAVVTAITTNPQIAALSTAVTEYEKATAALNISVSSLGLAVGGVGTSLASTLQPLVKAINDLAAAIAGMKLTTGGLQSPVTVPPPVTGPTTGPSAPTAPTAPITPSSPSQDVSNSISDLQSRYGVPAVAGAFEYVQSAVAAGDALGLAQAAIAAGVPSSDLSTLLALNGVAISAAEISDWAASQGLPRFARGGFHAGGLRIVGENGPELEATGAARIWNADQTRNMLSGSSEKDDEIVEVLEEVRDLLVAIGYETRATAGHTNKAARILDRVTKDGEAITTTPLV